MTRTAASPPASPPNGRPEQDGHTDREATEMRDYIDVPRSSSIYISPSTQNPRACTTTSNGGYLSITRKCLAKLWQRQVSVTVPHDACRDHLGTLVSLFPCQASSDGQRASTCTSRKIMRLLRTCEDVKVGTSVDSQ